MGHAIATFLYRLFYLHSSDVHARERFTQIRAIPDIEATMVDPATVSAKMVHMSTKKHLDL